MATKNTDPTLLSAKDIKIFEDLLEDQRKILIAQAKEALAQSHGSDEPTHLAGDEVDQSTAEYEQAFEYRLRDREKFLLKKVHKALRRIEEGEYNVCEACDGPIGRARLKARPVATLCIECKEEQERNEKKYQKKRAYKLDFEF
jgi:DnaK suppressor protein